MSRLRTLLSATLLLTALAASPGSANPVAGDRQVTLAKGETSLTWQGEVATGTNANYFGTLGDGDGVLPAQTCSKDKRTYCETVRAMIENPFEEGDFDVAPTRLRRVVVTVDEYAPVAMSDFDLVVFAIGADGGRGAQLGQSSANAGQRESVEFVARFGRDTASVGVLVDVVYWLVPESGYTGTLRWRG